MTDLELEAGHNPITTTCLPPESICPTCTLLALSSTLKSWNRKKEYADPELSTLIVRRLVITSSPLYPESCTSCSILSRLGYLGLRVTKTICKDLSLWGAENLKRDAWFWVYDSKLHCRTGKSFGHVTKTIEFSTRTSGQRDLTQEPPLADVNCFDRSTYVKPYLEYELINAWLHHCIQRHETCRPRPSTALDSIMLIDVETSSLTRYSSLAAGDRDYVALSYVWGDRNMLTSPFGQIPSNLPRTIEESFLFVRGLGIKHLWVDSLCIDQSQKTTKMEQIAIMDKIYAGAHATIVALDGTHADAGLPGVSSQARDTQLSVWFGSHEFVAEPPPLEEQLSTCPWVIRGWTLQEGKLSHRCLILSNHQAYFVCSEMEASEHLGIRYHKLSTNRHWGVRETRRPACFGSIAKMAAEAVSKDSSHLQTYLTVINEYKRRRLSHDSDALNAVNALLNEMKRTILPEGFIFGLPLSCFRGSLIWREQESGVSNRYLYETLNYSSQYRNPEIPTWSWARWSLQLDLEIPRVESSPIQPPLVVTAQGVRIVDTSSDALSIKLWTQRLTIEGTKKCQPIAEIPSMHVTEKEGKLMVQQKVRMIACTCALYAKRELQKVDDKSFFQNEKSTALLIRGILLTIPVATGGLDKDGAHSGEPNASLVMSVPLADVEWRNDGRVSNIAVANQPSALHDFLFVAIRVSPCNQLVVQLLHLYWEAGVASRGGTVDIYIDAQHVVPFWCECQARTCCFWLN